MEKDSIRLKTKTEMWMKMVYSLVKSREETNSKLAQAET